MMIFIILIIALTNILHHPGDWSRACFFCVCYYCWSNYFQNTGIGRISSVNCAAGITSRSNPSSPLFVLSFCGLNEWQVGLLPAFSHAQIGLSPLAALDPGCVQETIDSEHKVNYAWKLDSLNVGKGLAEVDFLSALNTLHTHTHTHTRFISVTCMVYLGLCSTVRWEMTQTGIVPALFSPELFLGLY